MCLLTACRAEESEDKRRIVGTFMVKDDFFGSDCTDGIIPAHSVYRLRLPLDQQPLFWLHVAGELAQQHWVRRLSSIYRTARRKRFSSLSRTYLPLPEDEKSCAADFYRYYLPERSEEEDDALVVNH